MIGRRKMFAARCCARAAALAVFSCCYAGYPARESTLSADDSDNYFSQSAVASDAPSGAGHAAWYEGSLREVFTPPQIDEVPVQQPPALGGIPDPAPLRSETMAPLPTESDPLFSPNSDYFFDGLSVFGGLDGSKQPQDLGVNANMGGRISFNWGHALIEDWHLGIQAGGALNFSDNAVQVLDRLGAGDERNQFFGTIGLFQRTGWGFNWNFAYDSLYERYYDRFHLSQWRGRAGYQVSDLDELGVWGTIADSGDSGTVLGTPVHVKAISQANFFWRHTWASSAWTTFWIGTAHEHGRFVLLLPDLPAVKNAFVYGSDLQMPLNDRWAIYGEANFITPASSGTVDAYLGFVYYPGGGARQALQKRYAPLMPTASNTSFAVDLHR
ncbi:MAG TPA: DUF6666 family protein [Planctomycetaceae bacterium]|nr:DUF6666 family protein [Planctomycetaceae bacterium]